MLADTGPQVVDSQINGAQPGKAGGVLLKTLIRVSGAQGSRYSDAACSVQRGADNAAMQTPFNEVANQLVPHGQINMCLLGCQRLQLQTQQLVKKKFS